MQETGLVGELNNPTLIFEGKSAYDIAVEKGFEGDEEAWLESLKGEKGERGPEGPRGSRGETGPKGDTGEIGPKGNDGDSAYKIWLSLGNIGSEQEFISSLKGNQGSEGPKGEKGEQGPQGIQGEKGDIGEPGPQGVQGPQGIQGETGYTPIRGTDYWTDEDIANMNSYIDTQINIKITNAIGGEY